MNPKNKVLSNPPNQTTNQTTRDTNSNANGSATNTAKPNSSHDISNHSSSSPKPGAGEQYTSESINDAIRKLQGLADVQLKLCKERKSIESLELFQKMLDGELLSEEELETIKTSLKGLSKYASLHSSYRSRLEEAQHARDLIDHIIGVQVAQSENLDSLPQPDVADQN
ncbi:MAG TPA: hypothetical protein ACFE0H_00655 [Elainellaceae cyanobacterium]|jgi:hypothetical protein